ncbi:MAG: hypothetical protein CMJ48_07270 [Planctomycetaceae bacterium]|nr:hypothetical protein [Planctomycetaceae bacterium]
MQLDAQDHILDHFEARRYRRDEVGDRKSELGNDRLLTATVTHQTCGDGVSLWLELDDDAHITRARFEAHGCTICQAAASMLCERIEGTPLEEARTFEAQEMLELVGIPLTPRRRRCALLAWEALAAVAATKAEVGNRKSE